MGKLQDRFNAEMKSKGKAKANWSGEVERLRRIIKVFAAKMKTKNADTERVTVDLSVIEMWERLHADTSTHDVALATADGDVTAHSLVLTHASPVLAAMLSSTMSEGSQKRINITDASGKGTSFFLDLLYAGSSESDISYPDALVALDLSHRWQALVAVNILVRALTSMVSDESFAEIAEAAVSKNLVALQRACM